MTKKCIGTHPTQTLYARVLNSFMKNENLSISKVPRLSQNRPVQIGLKEPNVFASPFKLKMAILGPLYSYALEFFGAR